MKKAPGFDLNNNMKKTRKNNINNLIHRRLSEILVLESKDPRFKKVTISRVEADPSLSFAKVLVSIFPSEGEIELIAMLNNASGFFSRQLGKILNTRKTPQLKFIYDAGYDYSDEIENLLKSVLQKESNTLHRTNNDLSSGVG